MNWHALFEQTAGEDNSSVIVNDLVEYLYYFYATCGKHRDFLIINGSNPNLVLIYLQKIRVYKELWLVLERIII